MQCLDGGSTGGTWPVATSTGSSTGEFGGALNRGSLIQLKSWLALRPCRLAIDETDTPGVRVSATIWRFSSVVQERRGHLGFMGR